MLFYRRNVLKRSAAARGAAAACFAVLVYLTGCGGGLAKLSQEGLTDVPHVYAPPEPVQWLMPNGIKVMYLHDPELPVVRGAVVVRGGTLQEQPNQTGAVGALAGLMRQGGAGARSADQLDRDLEKLSASVESAAGAESLKVSFGCLSADVDQVFSIFADVLLRPRLEQGRIDLWKGQNLEAVRRRADEPSTVAGLAIGELLYGWGPYGRYVLEDDVRRVNRETLQALHRERVVPDGAIVVVSGDIPRERVEQLLNRHLGQWAASGRPQPEAPPVDYAPQPGIYYISLPFVQSTIYMGELGVPRLTEDYIGIEGFNEIFGASGFGSMLMQRIRTELGLAYSVFGGILPGPVRGKNIIALQTKSDSAGTAIVETLKVLRGMQREEVDAGKVSEAKRSISNSFIFRFDSLDEVLNRRALQTFLNYPPDYDATFLPKIAALTPGDVRTVAERRWHPDKLVIVVVGDEKAYASLKAAVAGGGEELAGYQLFPAVFDSRVRPAVIEKP